MRIFLDTNVLASAFGTRGLCVDVFRIVLSEHELVLGECVLVELKRVLSEKFKIPKTTVKEIDTFLREFEVVDIPEPPYSVRVRDKDDEVILESAIQAKADILISGDQDLLELEGKIDFKILSPREFWVFARSGIRR